MPAPDSHLWPDASGLVQEAAAILLILILWGLVTVSLVKPGGVRLPGFAIYLVITLLARLLLGMRAGVVVAVE